MVGWLYWEQTVIYGQTKRANGMKWWIKGIIASVLWIALVSGGFYLYIDVLLPGKLTESQDDAFSRLAGLIAGGGLVAIWVALYAKFEPQPNVRTAILFQPKADIRPALDAWAQDNGFVEQQRNGPETIYQKGRGVLLYPMMFSVRFANDGVHFNAWVRANPLMRLCALYIIPAEMGVESGGWRLALPRKVARTAINKLLTQLEQPTIA